MHKHRSIAWIFTALVGSFGLLVACSAPAATTSPATVTITESVPADARDASQTVTVTVTSTAAVDRAVDVDEPNASGGETAEPSDGAAAPSAVELVGTAEPSLPEGQHGELALVAQGVFDGNGSYGGSVPIIVRNNTDEALHSLEAAGSAKDGSGNLVGSGSDQGFRPDAIAPGNIAIGYVYFDGGDVAVNDDISIEVSGEPGLGDYVADLTVSEINDPGDSILGKISNDTGSKVEGPISVMVMCFTKDGEMIDVLPGGGFAEKDSLPAGKSTTFSVDQFDAECPTYLVGASGYFL